MRTFNRSQRRDEEPPARTCSERVARFKQAWVEEYGRTPRDWSDPQALRDGTSSLASFSEFVDDGRTDLALAIRVLHAFAEQPSYNKFRRSYFEERGKGGEPGRRPPPCDSCNRTGTLYRVQGMALSGEILGINPRRRDPIPLRYAHVLPVLCICQRATKDARILQVCIPDFDAAMSYAETCVETWKLIEADPDHKALIGLEVQRLASLPRVGPFRELKDEPAVSDADFEAARTAFTNDQEEV